MSEPTTDRTADRTTLLEWVDQVADRFETAWQTGLPPDLAQFCAGHPPHQRVALLTELVKIDLEYRGRAGESRHLDDYLRDFPELRGPNGRPPEDLVRHAWRVTSEPEGSLTPAGTKEFTKALGRFQLVGLLGRGSFGVVYQARDLELGRLVALKVPHAGAFTSSAEQERFLREARHTAGLRHPAIVPIHEIAYDHGVPYIVSEYVEGKTLAEVLAERRPTYREAAELVARVADALHFAHRRQVIHRDVNPHNILLDAAGQPRVTDFGLARGAGPEPTLTGDGQVLGTPAYMSPEQAAGRSHQVDGRSDVYSLGAVLYELLSGERPFRGSTHMLLHQVVCDDPPPPRRLDGHIPRDLETICLKAMAKAPARRYATAGELADDLRRFLDGRPILARPVGFGERVWRWCRRNPAAASLVVVVFTALVAVAAASTRAALVSRARERDLRREVLIQQLQHERLVAHAEGWSDKAWELVTEAAALGRDERLQAEATATLAGLDARIVKAFPGLAASSAAFDPTGRYLLLGGTDTVRGQPPQPARIWDSTTDQIRLSQQTGNGPVAFRPDGTPVQLVVREGPAFVLWDVAKQQELATCRFDGGPVPPGVGQVKAMALTPDGSRVAAATESSGKGILAAWEGATGRLLFQTPEPATALAFSPDGAWLAAGQESGKVLIWSVMERKPAGELDGGRSTIGALAFSPDGRYLALGDAHGHITVWDWAARRQVSSCRGVQYYISTLAFSPDGSVLASGGHGQARLWEATTGRLLLVLNMADFQTGLAFTRDGRRLAAVARFVFAQAEARVWELGYDRGIQTLRGLVSPISRVWFSPDERCLAALAGDWQVGVWDLATGRLERVLQPRPGLSPDNASLAFSPDGRRIAFSSGTEARLWELATGRVVEVWRLPKGLGDTLAFPTADRLMLFRAEQTTPDGLTWVYRVRNLVGAEPTRPVAEVSAFNRLLLSTAGSPDGSCFIVEGMREDAGGQHQATVALDSTTGRELWQRPRQKTTISMDLMMDPGGRYVATTREVDGSWVLLDLPTGRTVESLPNGVNCLGPEATTVIATYGDPALPNLGFGLRRRGEFHPYVVVGKDAQNSKSLVFHRHGHLFAWGNVDGTISLCRLPEVRARLYQVGLGW